MTAAPAFACPHADARAVLALSGAARAWCPCGAWVDRAPDRVQTYRAPLEAPAPPRADDDEAPAPRPRPPALSEEADELTLVRTTLFALRPDFAEPLKAPPKTLTASFAPTVRDPTASWGDVPAGLDETGAVIVRAGTDSRAALVLARLATLDPGPRVVLRWLRDHAALVDDEGAVKLRALFVEAGKQFPAASGARGDRVIDRDRDAIQGRALVVPACEEWERTNHE